MKPNNPQLKPHARLSAFLTPTEVPHPAPHPISDIPRWEFTSTDNYDSWFETFMDMAEACQDAPERTQPHQNGERSA